MGQPTVRLFYRLVLAAQPTEVDFYSGEALGQTVPADPAVIRLWRGVSVQNTEVQARARARGMPWLGVFIAVLAIPDDDETITFERTGKSRVHYTFWGEPSKLLGYVVRVVPV